MGVNYVVQFYSLVLVEEMLWVCLLYGSLKGLGEIYLWFLENLLGLFIWDFGEVEIIYQLECVYFIYLY